MFFSINSYFNPVIVIVENTTSHNYVEQNGRRMFKDNSETVTNSVLISKFIPTFYEKPAI